MTRLFLTNIPYDCQDAELRNWIESQGFDVNSLRVIRDLVAGVSPAFGYVSLGEATRAIDAVRILDGQNLGGRTVQVREDWRNECRGG
jgi:RNA recognition motif-containing protein